MQRESREDGLLEDMGVKKSVNKIFYKMLRNDFTACLCVNNFSEATQKQSIKNINYICYYDYLFMTTEQTSADNSHDMLLKARGSK